jgi:ubiquinone/menaquinone biosynthesis C-methylase UbiE
VTEVPDFSRVAKEYDASRPGYPEELFAWLADSVAKRETALDVATGTGQAAWGLANHFDHVIAIDVSAEQLRHARGHPRIEYRVARAETTGLPDGSVDLAVAAAAIHWFDRPRFNDELRRVMRRHGVVAAWTYHVAHVDPPLDAILGAFYRDVVGRYYPPAVRLVDERYSGIELPGEELAAPSFQASVRWDARQVARFVRTWSVVPTFIEATKRDPVPALEAEIEAAFGGPDIARDLSFPLYLRVARCT